MAQAEKIPDVTILDRCRSGDESAFTLLVERHAKDAFALAYRMTGSVEDAEDLSQEAFIVVFRKLSTFRGESRFSTWLYRIVLNLCRRHDRRQRLRAALSFSRGDEEKEIEPRTEVTPESRLVAVETGRAALAVLEGLPSKQREVFVLRHFQGLKIREIAEILTCAEGTVKAHLFRAVHRVKKELEEKE
ncbi:MAG: RNA polymerase sigma factor [Deltaproteobacteria bacterium]|nr:RNA polymerase sigma factor [Deltaproteobacteria bacterium]